MKYDSWRCVSTNLEAHFDYFEIRFYYDFKNICEICIMKNKQNSSNKREKVILHGALRQCFMYRVEIHVCLGSV